jgi:hypothetical protein
MSIPIVCPQCAAELNAPDSVAGKRVRCLMANCGAVISVPAPLLDELEVVEEEAMATPYPDPEEGADSARLDDEDDSDRRSKRSRRSTKGQTRGLLVGIVIGCLISLVGLGYCAYAFGLKKFLAANQPEPDEPRVVGGIGGGSDSAGGPSTWKQFSYQEHGFRARFPREPVRREEQLQKGADLKEVAHSRTFYGAISGREKVYTQVVVYHFRPEMSVRERGYYLAGCARGTAGEETTRSHRPVTWAGQPAWEVTVSPNSVQKSYGSIRYALIGLNGILAMIADENRLSDESQQAFFNGFEFLQPGKSIEVGVLAAVKPTEWKEHRFLQHEFAAVFPQEPVSQELPVDEAAKSAGVLSRSFLKAGAYGGPLGITVLVIRFREDVPQEQLVQAIPFLIESMRDKTKGAVFESRNVTFAGRSAHETKVGDQRSGMVVRTFSSESRIYQVMIWSYERWPTDKEREAFFDSFTLPQ